MREFIRNLPKAELHLHIEGTFEPELMFEIAHRNDVQIPYKNVEDLRKAYNFNCLQDFLDIYYQGAGVLLHEKDFYDLTMAYFRRIRSQGVLHTEIMFDPQTHTSRGVPFDTVINGIYRACRDSEKEWGITSFLIMSYLRHLPEEEAFKTLQESLPHKDKIKAVGLDSSEKGNPPSKFAKVFEASVKEGYLPVAHAGEEGSPEYVWEALDILKVLRIDHGNRALEDDMLIREIVRRDIAFTVCPLSNLALQVITDMKKHPLIKMLEAGLKPTVNSDDPAYFGGYINDNFLSVYEHLSLTRRDICRLAKNSFQYSFLDERQKQIYLNRLDEYCRGH